MHIAIDGRTIVHNRTGVGVYTDRLVRSLLQIDSRNSYTVFLLEDNPSLSGPNLTKVMVDRYAGMGPNRFWENFVLPLFLSNNRVDVYFSPAYILPVLHRAGGEHASRTGTKFVVTVHDLVSYIYPETFTLKMRLWQRIFVSNAIRVADRILADSEATKQDILTFYKYDPDRVNVVHLPIGEHFKRVTDCDTLQRIRTKHDLPEKFILYVGTLEPRKNVARLAKAYAALPAQLRQEYALVLTGAPGWFSEQIIREIDDLHLAERIRRIGYVDQRDLPAMYTLASAFCYLSVYEGFGAPPIEAMACGTPVLCSNSSSLPEAVGDAGLLVDPHEVGLIAAQLERLLTDERLRNDLIQRGLDRIGQFNALSKAREVLRIFEEVVGR
jgi:glycosyltransferase involved in cell wall biosynthesis